jgi:hypothetical protein
LLLLALLLAAPPARAQLGISAGVGVGAHNNNVEVKGDTEESSGASNESDGLARTLLGLHYAMPGRNSTQVFDYSLQTYFYIQRTQSVSFANELGWTGLINPTRFSELDFSLRASQGRTSDMDLFQGQDLGGSQARPVTSEQFLSGSATQSLRWELGPFWEFGERLNSEIYFPIGAATRITPRTFGGEAQLTLSRVWTQDELGLFVEGGHGRSTEVVFTEPMEGLLGYPARRANWVRVGLDYGHAFNDYWSARFDGGVLGVQVPQIRDPFVDWGGGLSITHRTARRGSIVLRAERGIDTNVYVGDVLLQNSVGLQAEVPFGYKESWHLSGDIEFQQSESLFVIDVKESLKVIALSAILAHDMSRQARLLFELNFTYQDSEAGLRNSIRADPFTSFRTMFLVSLEMHYPQLEEEVGGGMRLGGRGGVGGGDEGAEEEEEEPGTSDTGTGSGDSGGSTAPP